MIQQIKLSEAIAAAHAAYAQGTHPKQTYNAIRQAGFSHDAAKLATDTLWHTNTMRSIHRRWGLK